MKIQHFCIAAGVAVSSLFSPLVAALQVPGPVVDTAWLAANQNQVVILDIRKKPKSFAKGHIPGSVYMNWKKQARMTKVVDGVKLIKMLPDKATFEATMQSLGVNNDSAVILSNKGKNADAVTKATRVYWTLKYYGHDNVAILDGGFAQWKKDKRPISTEATPPEKGNFTARAERKELYASTADVKQAIQDDSIQLVDHRELNFYLGSAMKDYVSAQGHIPSAKNFPPSMITHWKAPATLVANEDLRNILSALNIDANKASIAYCNSGHLASGAWFVMSELLGNKNVRVYDGSLHAWTKDKDAPMVTMKVD